MLPVSPVFYTSILHCIIRRISEVDYHSKHEHLRALLKYSDYFIAATEPGSGKDIVAMAAIPKRREKYWIKDVALSTHYREQTRHLIGPA